ncbi:MAG: molecular chaperone TorD family protein [Tepidiformaceae bacterium]
MFVYSLAGLQVDGEALQEMELPDNEITARTGVYQLLARMVSVPDEDAYSAAVGGGWGGRLAGAATLLGFPFAFGNASIESSVSREDFQAEFLRAFEIGTGEGPPAPLYGGTYGDNRMQRLEEVVRFYEYFGLTTSAEDPRPADHLATELEFMKYLTYKEAVSPSPRLRTSYRRAQQDFLDRQLVGWLPKLAAKTREAKTTPYWEWVVDTVAGFGAADAAYVSSALVA